MVKNRNKLSAALAVVVALATLAFLCTIVMSVTLTSREYIKSNLITDEVLAESRTQLDRKYAQLEKESGIPIRVFKMKERQTSVATALDTAAQNIFTADSPSLYNRELVEYYYDLCVEYLEGNALSYDEESVYNAAEKAARLYSESVGLYHVEDVQEKLQTMNRAAATAASVAFAVAMSAFGGIMIMYKRKTQGYYYALGGFTAGGFGAVLGALLTVLAHPYSKLNIQPAVYSESIAAMSQQYFLLMALVGAVVTVGAFMTSFAIYRKQQKED